jgi:hypothetical protein
MSVPEQLCQITALGRGRRKWTGREAARIECSKLEVLGGIRRAHVGRAFGLRVA